MNLKQTMTELRKLGTAQTVKTYLRHGASEPLYGVKFGDLNKLKKKTGVDHALALELWETGNSDAQTFALMICEPSQMRSSQLDTWLRPLSYYLLVDMLASVTARSKFAAAKWAKWHRSKSDQTSTAGYGVLTNWLCHDAERVPDELITAALALIDSSIHDAPNRTRHAMNGLLIAAGVYRSDLRQEAIRVAKAIGKVEVDHGQTACKTPDAVAYINKAVARRKN